MIYYEYIDTFSIFKKIPLPNNVQQESEILVRKIENLIATRKLYT